MTAPWRWSGHLPDLATYLRASTATGLLRWIDHWRTYAYTVSLVFTALDSPDLAVRRVATRVSLGGHDVPEPTVRRRWAAGLRSLFDLYLPVVDRPVVISVVLDTNMLVSRFGWSGPPSVIVDMVVHRRLLLVADAVDPATTLAVVADEPDNRVLEAATEEHVDAIVTGDAGLLELDIYDGIPILTAAAFLDWFPSPGD